MSENEKRAGETIKGSDIVKGGNNYDFQREKRRSKRVGNY